MMKQRFFIEIIKNAGGYACKVYQNGRELWALESLDLGPQTTIPIKGSSYSLQALINALIGRQPEFLKTVYDERGQLTLGRFLAEQIQLDRLLESVQSEGPKELRIVAEDEHMARLPWVLLVDRSRHFLSTTGWSIHLSTTRHVEDEELPPAPRLLVVAPQPEGKGTGAKEHLLALQETLMQVDSRFNWNGDRLRVVEKWETFQKQIEIFKPDLLYFYGHGGSDGNSSKLLFASGPQKVKKYVSMAELGVCLQKSGHPPLVAYLNCCKGDAGGWLGAGKQLGSIFPAVLSNRTVAKVSAAQAQGLAFWRSVIVEGQAPHRAVAAIRQELGGLKLSLSDTRWMTPVLHCRYDQWHSNPPEPLSRKIHDPHWHLRLDRVDQFSKVFFLSTQMLQEGKPKATAFLWHGAEGQGVNLFHDRLTVELVERMSQVQVLTIELDWPLEFGNRNVSFEAMINEAFDTQTLDHLPGEIRARSRGARGQTLVYLKHQPITSPKVLPVEIVAYYMEWLHLHFIPQLPENTFALVGISFITDKAKALEKALSKNRIHEVRYESMAIQVLEPLERLKKRHLLDFLQTHNIRLPPRFEDKILEQILNETQGHYDLTLDALKQKVAQAWDYAEEIEEGEGEVGSGDDEEEW